MLPKNIWFLISKFLLAVSLCGFPILFFLAIFLHILYGKSSKYPKLFMLISVFFIVPFIGISIYLSLKHQKYVNRISNVLSENRLKFIFILLPAVFIVVSLMRSLISRL